MKTISAIVKGYTWRDTITATKIAYHRNGIGGEPFFVVLFTHADKDYPGTFMAFVFDKMATVAIINLDKAAQGIIGVGMDNCWRGDVYEPALREILAQYSALPHERKQQDEEAAQ